MSAQPIILADNDDRKRFINGLTSNFGVVAPAGVGKTHSIVSRIVAMANASDALETLPTLVVVTYTNRAAQEMQQRARAAILANERNVEILGAFNRAFFGTIHSFCLRLLQSYGHFIGVSGRAQLLEDDAELWNRFVQTQTGRGSVWQEPWMRTLLRHVPVGDLFSLARGIDPRTIAGAVPDMSPDVRASELLDFVPERAPKKIVQDQATLKRWLEALRHGTDFLPLPEPESSAKAFTVLWRETFQPLRQWLGRAALRIAVELAREYQAYRVSSGALTFQDQVTLAADLLSNPEAARQIRRENYRIILDEAQDTDPEQFFVLMESAKDPFHPGAKPRAGHFSMVGDHQQSIYRKRADIAVYQRLHGDLTASDSGDEAKFSVTFRCAQRVVDFVNTAFPHVLPGKEGQVSFVPLIAKATASSGQVVRFALRETDTEDPEKKLSDGQRAAEEARQLADFVKTHGLFGLRAREWGQVAILCPRKLWFAPLVQELERVGIPCQVHSLREIAGDSPVYAWFTALMWVMAHPLDGYEIVGVLRELYGISDHDLSVFADGDTGVFQIAVKKTDDSAVGQQLHALMTLREAVMKLPLRDAVRRVVSETQLRERLLSLPLEWSAEEIERELDDLLINATSVELDGGQWLDFAQRLRDGFYRQRESDIPRRNAVQILTCQKAKGLEWDAVIVPFMFRKIRSASPRYPVCWKEPGATESVVFLSSEDAHGELKEAGKLAERQEFERFLYVTCTRARETLVLVDDRKLFDPKADDYAAASFGNLLIRNNQANLSTWEALPMAPQPDSASVLVKVEVRAQGELNFGDSSTMRSRVFDLAAVRVRVDDFPRRVTPHALARHYSAEESEVRAEKSDDDRPDIDLQTPATIYGTWWHGLMEALPWNENVERWQEVFERLLPESIDPERSRCEWELFLKSSLVPLLNQRDWIFQSEMPFLWRSGPEQVVEGVMDLAAFNPKTMEWLVADWKTNRLGGRGVEELVEIYQAQIEAYMKALGEMFKHPVRGLLYSTTLGQFHYIDAKK